MEFNLLELASKSDSSNIEYSKYAYHMVCKGMKEKFNYLITEDRFYDLQFLLPFTHMGTGKNEDPS